MIVLATGIQRSGSTWAYNVCRVSMNLAFGEDNVYWGWGVSPYEITKRHAIIKQHEPVWDRELINKVVHTTRDYDECIQSMKEMFPDDPITKHRIIVQDRFWSPLADVIIHHEDLLRSTVFCASLIVQALELNVDPEEVDRQVNAIKIPETEEERETQLQVFYHPNHRRNRPHGRE